MKGPGLSENWRKQAEMRRARFIAAWGPEKVVLDISQTDVDRFARLRCPGELAPDLGGRASRGVRHGTIDGDFRWLSSAFNWARRHKEAGRRILPEKPLHDVKWPKEQNPRRPVASHDRYVRTLGHVDTVDREGRLRCILALARYSGRREGAIFALRASNVLARWLERAEKAAGLPKLRGGLWHPYRRLWASERKHLPDVDVAAAGGWKDTRALKLSYQQADPATVLRVVEHRG